MAKWDIGVFTSVDAGLGVHFEVAQELEYRLYNFMHPLLRVALQKRLLRLWRSVMPRTSL